MQYHSTNATAIAGAGAGASIEPRSGVELELKRLESSITLMKEQFVAIDKKIAPITCASPESADKQTGPAAVPDCPLHYRLREIGNSADQLRYALNDLSDRIRI